MTPTMFPTEEAPWIPLTSHFEKLSLGYNRANLNLDCLYWIRSIKKGDKGWSGWRHMGQGSGIFWSTQATTFWQRSVVTASVSEGLPRCIVDMICGALTQPPPHMSKAENSIRRILTVYMSMVSPGHTIQYTKKTMGNQMRERVCLWLVL